MGKLKGYLVPMALGAVGAILALRFVPGAASAAKVVSTKPATK